MKRDIYTTFFKRIFDFSITLLALLFIWPILLLIYICLRFSIGTPVLFKQIRPGFMGKPFVNYKFRTMTEQRDANGNLLPDEQRITNVGRILRSLSLDELPEIFNVLKGDMSIVGPRPLLMQYIGRYTPEQARRHEVLPGITGWVQINGRNDLSWEEKFKLDVWYVDHKSFQLDMYIIAKTFWKVFHREGISHDGYVGAPEFMGTQSDANAGQLGSETKEPLT